MSLNAMSDDKIPIFSRVITVRKQISTKDKNGFTHIISPGTYYVSPVADSGGLIFRGINQNGAPRTLDFTNENDSGIFGSEKFKDPNYVSVQINNTSRFRDDSSYEILDTVQSNYSVPSSINASRIVETNSSRITVGETTADERADIAPAGQQTYISNYDFGNVEDNWYMVSNGTIEWPRGNARCNNINYLVRNPNRPTDTATLASGDRLRKIAFEENGELKVRTFSQPIDLCLVQNEFRNKVIVGVEFDHRPHGISESDNTRFKVGQEIVPIRCEHLTPPAKVFRNEGSGSCGADSDLCVGHVRCRVRVKNGFLGEQTFEDNFFTACPVSVCKGPASDNDATACANDKVFGFNHRAVQLNRSAPIPDAARRAARGTVAN